MAERGSLSEQIMNVRVKMQRARNQFVEPDAISLLDLMDDLAFLMMEIADRNEPSLPSIKEEGE